MSARAEPCAVVLDRIDAYVDGELSPAERDAVAAHLRGCDECRAVHEGVAEIARGLEAAYAGFAPAPDAVSARVLAELPGPGPIAVAAPGGARGGLLAAAAALLAAAILLAASLVLEPRVDPLAEPFPSPERAPGVARLAGEPGGPVPAGPHGAGPLSPPRPTGGALPVATEVFACVSRTLAIRREEKKVRVVAPGDAVEPGEVVESDGFVSLATPAGGRVRVNERSTVAVIAEESLELIAGELHATAPAKKKLLVTIDGDCLALDPGAVAVVSRDRDGTLLWSMVDGAGDLTCASGSWGAGIDRRLESGFEARKRPGEAPIASRLRVSWVGEPRDGGWVAGCRSIEPPESPDEIRAVCLRYVRERLTQKFAPDEPRVEAFGDRAVAPLVAILKEDDLPERQRHFAARLAGRLALADRSLLALADLLEDRDPEVRVAAWTRLTRDAEVAAAAGDEALWRSGDAAARAERLAAVRGILASRRP